MADMQFMIETMQASDWVRDSEGNDAAAPFLITRATTLTFQALFSFRSPSSP